MIPKIIHRIWLGDRPPPYPEWWQEWQDLHPGWVCLIHTQLPHALVHASAFPIVGRVDLMKLWALREYGGFYVDCDVKAVSSLEPLRETGFCVPITYGRSVSNCFSGSTQDHAALLNLWEVASQVKEVKDVSRDVGSGLWTRVLANHRGITRLKPYLVDALAAHRNSRPRIAAHYGVQKWKD